MSGFVPGKLSWHYADGTLSIATERGVTVHLEAGFANEAVNMIARLHAESRPVDDFLAGLFLCGCATASGHVSFAPAEHVAGGAARAGHPAVGSDSFGWEGADYG
tara:strand:- start:3095 stop:3409 length:315 start_codon:yes stop_codon:yes gene_type:complete